MKPVLKVRILKTKGLIRISGVIVVFCLVISSVRAQGTWTRENIPTTRYLRSVCFVDSLTGWVSGDSGTILHTTDGGNTWVPQGLQSGNEIVSIFFLDHNRGWASEYNYSTLPYGTIFHRTTDGGVTWQSQTLPFNNVFMSCIFFINPQKGWMGARPNGLYKTVDGGLTWNSCAIDTSTLAFFPVENLNFWDENIGYACGGILDIAGVVWTTTNGGDNWKAIDIAFAPPDEVHSLHLFDPMTVIGAGGDPDFGYGVGFLRTSNGGLSWTYQEISVPGNAWDLDFRNATEAWAPLGPKLKMIYTLDAGQSWTPVMSPDSTAIFRLTFPDSLHGYAVGKDGAFLKYHPPVIPGITPRQGLGSDILLYQNFPNPANKATTFRFLLPESINSNGLCNEPMSLRIIIENLCGQVLSVIECGRYRPGTHDVRTDISGLPAGCYLYRLQGISSGRVIDLTSPGRMIISK